MAASQTLMATWAPSAEHTGDGSVHTGAVALRSDLSSFPFIFPFFHVISHAPFLGEAVDRESKTHGSLAGVGS